MNVKDTPRSGSKTGIDGKGPKIPRNSVVRESRVVDLKLKGHGLNGCHIVSYDLGRE